MTLSVNKNRIPLKLYIYIYIYMCVCVCVCVCSCVSLLGTKSTENRQRETLSHEFLSSF